VWLHHSLYSGVAFVVAVAMLVMMMMIMMRIMSLLFWNVNMAIVAERHERMSSVLAVKQR
jgi:hypothetical protein